MTGPAKYTKPTTDNGHHRLITQQKHNTKTKHKNKTQNNKINTDINNTDINKYGHHQYGHQTTATTTTMSTDKPSSNCITNNVQKIRAASLTDRAPTITIPVIIANSGANSDIVPKKAIRIGSTTEKPSSNFINNNNQKIRAASLTNNPVIIAKRIGSTKDESAKTINSSATNRVVCNFAALTLSDNSSRNSMSASTSSEIATSNSERKVRFNTAVQETPPPSPAQPPPPPITTKKTKSSRTRTQELIEGDKIELCQWIKSSNSGVNRDFKVGKQRRHALHRLCQTLIEANPGLLLTHNSYGSARARLLKIEIDTKSPTLIIPTATAARISTGSGATTNTTTEATASVIAAAAAAAAASDPNEKLERWEKSTAKQVLSTLLRDKTSWANKIIDSDPSFGVHRSRSTSKTIETIHVRNILFKLYPIKNFTTNLRSLKNAIDTENINVEFDQKAFDREIVKYPMQRMLKAGYPRWNHPDNHAKKLLEEDTKKGGIYETENLNPKDLKVSRPEYRDFPDKIFRNRLYKAKSAHIEKPYWQNERNKSMRKKKVTEENLQQSEWI